MEGGSGGVLRAVEHWDGLQWADAAPLLHRRYGLEVVEVAGTLFALGGKLHSGQTTADVECYELLQTTRPECKGSWVSRNTRYLMHHFVARESINVDRSSVQYKRPIATAPTRVARGGAGAVAGLGRR